MYIDNHMNWKNHIEQILPKLSVACFSIRTLTYTLNLDNLRMVYFAYYFLLLLLVYWGNSTNVHQVFKLQKRTVMAGVGPRSSCRGLFRKLKILPLPCQYVLSVMLFVIDNLKDFPTNAYVHSLDTRNKNQLCLRTVCLACVQRGLILWCQNL
jgi:hypothetical protein